jgi:hypothetical protein
MQNARMNSRQLDLLPAEIRDLFANGDPIGTWNKANKIVRSISPDIDLTSVHKVFDDVLHLFGGTYPGYIRIKTPYHDLPHTLDVFMCSVRLLHGVHVSGTPLEDDEISMILAASLLHDVGYAQQNSEATGSGAQFTRTHVSRGIAFMQQNLSSWQLPLLWEAPMTQMMRHTELGYDLSQCNFPNARIRLLGQIVGSADLVGQMADRIYLEKLLFLYLEFKEAELGGYKDMHDLLKKTRGFYELVRKLLDNEYGGVYQRLTQHFKNWVGIERNFYLESIERNIVYLDKVLALNEAEWLSMLKRHGIAKSIQQIATSTL